MENTNQIPTDDPRHGLALAVATARQIADAITLDRYSAPTPCEEFDVGQLLRHLSCAWSLLAAAGRGDELDWSTLVDDSYGDGEHSAALEAHAHAIAEAWADPAKLAQMYELIWATMPGAVVIGSYCAETLTHAWDMAVATGQKVEWPADEVIAPVLAGFQMGIGTEGRSQPDMPFEEVVDIAADAPMIEQLVAFAGRDPKAWPSAIAGR